jgi:hypothetical protein
VAYPAVTDGTGRRTAKHAPRTAEGGATGNEDNEDNGPGLGAPKGLVAPLP